MTQHTCKQVEKITSMESEIKHHTITLYEFKQTIDKLNNNLQRIYFSILGLLIGILTAVITIAIK